MVLPSYQEKSWTRWQQLNLIDTVLSSEFSRLNTFFQASKKLWDSCLSISLYTVIFDWIINDLFLFLRESGYKFKFSFSRCCQFTAAFIIEPCAYSFLGCLLPTRANISCYWLACRTIRKTGTWKQIRSLVLISLFKFS